MTFYDEVWDMGGGECIPGCFPQGQWCDQPGAGELGQCSFPPSQLCDALQRQEAGFSRNTNNEIVVDTSSVARHPPRMIEGFFMGGQKDDDVRVAYSSFIRLYRLDPETAPPLMRLDANADEPFTLDEYW
jgi:hypothetical protein